MAVCSAATGRDGRVALGALFGLNGFGFAALASRIPAVQSGLEVSTGHMGVLLLSLGAGALVTLPLAGWVCGRLGPRRSVAAGVAVVAVASVVVAVSLAGRTVSGVVLGLFVVGAGTSQWDVSMNVAGTALERALDEVLLPRLHALLGVGHGGAPAADVSVVSAIAYTAFLFGPPLIGLGADRIGLSIAMLASVPMVVAVMPLVARHGAVSDATARRAPAAVAGHH